MVLHSDGLSESVDQNGEQLEPDCWLELIQRCKSDDLGQWRDRIMVSLDDWRADHPRDDDWSLLLVRLE